jgi:4-hydroxy-tetrahydrodipicolinate synthase
VAASSSEAKQWAREHVRGQWLCPLGAVTDDDEIDEEGLRAGVRHCLRMKVGGLAFSSLMEPWSSTLAERRRGLEVFLDEVAGRVPVYVTAVDHSIKETVLLGRHAFDRGAAILVIECPYEHAKSETQVVDFFTYVCRSLDGPIAIYNTPHAGMILSEELISRLADIENVCAIKNAINSRAHSSLLFELAGDRMVVCDPTERNYLYQIEEHGQQVLFSSTASHLYQSPHWQPIEEYSALARTGDHDAALGIYQSIEPLRRLREEVYSVLHGPAHAQHPIAVTKYWQELMGMPAGPPRPPLRALDDEERAGFRSSLHATGLLDRLGVPLSEPIPASAR